VAMREMVGPVMRHTISRAHTISQAFSVNLFWACLGYGSVCAMFDLNALAFRLIGVVLQASLLVSVVVLVVLWLRQRKGKGSAPALNSQAVGRSGHASQRQLRAKRRDGARTRDRA